MIYLILTLVGNPDSDTFIAAIAPPYPFMSMKACVRAGETIARQHRRDTILNRRVMPSIRYSCVRDR